MEKEKRVKYYFLDNMFISFIITYAAGTICYEEYLPESFMNFFRPLMLAVCVCTWLYISFFSGVRSKWQFEIFAVIFWILPQLVIYLADSGPEICRMSVTLYALSELFLIMFNTPAEHIGGFIGVGAFPSIFIIVLLCTFAFLAGILLSDKLKKGNYTF